jgi:hypothetical protein
MFLLISSTICSTNYYIYDIEYNNRYFLDTLKFPSNKIPAGKYYFRIAVENLEETSITIQIKKNDIANFKVNVCGFYQRPTDFEIVDGADNIEIEESSKYIHSNYTYYRFDVPTLKKEEKIKYLVVTILNNEALDFLSVDVYPSNIDDSKEYTFYNITYMKEEILNKTTLSQHKGIFYFVSEKDEQEKNNLIRFKFNKKYSPDIDLSVAAFKERPTVEKELKKPVSHEAPSFISLKRDENYTIYEYLIKNSEINKQKYLVVGVKMDESLDFMSFYLGP